MNGGFDGARWVSHGCFFVKICEKNLKNGIFPKERKMKFIDKPTEKRYNENNNKGSPWPKNLVAVVFLRFTRIRRKRG